MDLPKQVRDAALAAFATYDPTLELAELVHDTVLGGDLGIGRATRVLHFAHPDAMVLVELRHFRAALAVEAEIHVCPAMDVAVERRPAEQVFVHTAKPGHVVVAHLQPGLFRLLLTCAPDMPVLALRPRLVNPPPRLATTWVRI